MAAVQPFRAVRYDERRAGLLETLIAPPYDVLGPEELERYRRRSKHNVVHLTLADEAEEAARRWAEWQRDGVLAREEEGSFWWLRQTFEGPDGVTRTRDGLVCSLRAEPYSSRVVLPHERTHAGPKEGRLRLLRALRAHVEPIFLLFDGSLPGAEGEPVLEAELEGVRNCLWRLHGDHSAMLAEAQLLIADGHHRYETTLAFHEEDGTEESAWLLAVIVPTGQADGVTIFPTHRLVERVETLDGAEPSEEGPLALLARNERPVLYRGGQAYVLPDVELDPLVVDRLAGGRVTYTPYAEEAIAAVDRGEAEAAFLLRPPTLEQVQAVAKRGQTMPQKSTYFYPKLPLGLLFHPLEPPAGSRRL